MVVVQFLKYPDIPHWRLESQRLGEDRFGVWLGAPAGSSARRGEEPPITLEAAYVHLIPRTASWTAFVNAPPARTELYVDATTVPVWVEEDRVEMVDLDLDVVRRRDGAVELLDEDEFLDHQRTLGYPPRLVAAARATAAELMLALEQRREPFGSAAERWLRQVT